MKKNIPALRFPQFADAPEWEIKMLNEVADINKGTQFNKILLNETGKYPCLNGGISPSGYSEKYNCNENTIIISEGGNSCGFVQFMQAKFWCGGHCYAIKIKKNWIDKYNNLYLYQILKYNELLIMNLRLGGALPNIQKKDLIKVSLFIPSLAEQTQIANFFAAVDNRILLLTEKHTQLKLYKKGIMQQIFSQKLRFKDENDEYFPDWEIKMLGEVCFKKYSNLAANKIVENFGNYPVYGAAGLLKHIDFCKEIEPYIAIVKDGAGIGRLLLCPSNSSVLGTLDVIKHNKNTNLSFLYYTLSTIDFKKYAIGSTIPHVYFSEYKQHKILFPSLAEQEKIGEFLSLIDAQIENVGQQVEKMQLWKRGLLQKMMI